MLTAGSQTAHDDLCATPATTVTGESKCNALGRFTSRSMTFVQRGAWAHPTLPALNGVGLADALQRRQRLFLPFPVCRRNPARRDLFQQT